MIQINGFATLQKLTDHFNLHGADLNAADETDYLQKARTFLAKDISNTSIQECLRSQGDLVRYDPVTEEFGVADAIGIIRTYYIPIPAPLAPPGTDLKRTHAFQTNYDYLIDTCTQY